MLSSDFFTCRVMRLPVSRTVTYSSPAVDGVAGADAVWVVQPSMPNIKHADSGPNKCREEGVGFVG